MITWWWPANRGHTSPTLPSYRSILYKCTLNMYCQQRKYITNTAVLQVREFILYKCTTTGQGVHCLLCTPVLSTEDIHHQHCHPTGQGVHSVQVYSKHVLSTEDIYHQYCHPTGQGVHCLLVYTCTINRGHTLPTPPSYR